MNGVVLCVAKHDLASGRYAYADRCGVRSGSYSSIAFGIYFAFANFAAYVTYCGALMDTKHLRWACRRGMLELDLILLPFLENTLPGLSDEEQHLFEKLLECEDQDMFAWFLRRVDPEDPEILRIVTMVRESTRMPES